MLKIFVLCLMIIGFLCPVVFAQDEDNYDSRGVLMLEEIVIQVAPELPTVVVTLPRQQPDIPKNTLQSPLERMIEPDLKDIKLDLSKMMATPLKDSEKMLVRER